MPIVKYGDVLGFRSGKALGVSKDGLIDGFSVREWVRCNMGVSQTWFSLEGIGQIGGLSTEMDMDR